MVRAVGAVLGIVVLAACTTGGQPDPERPEVVEPVDATISVAVGSSPATYNAGNRDAESAAALNQVLRTFTLVGADGTLVPDEEFGTYEKVTDSPLVVEYTIDPDAVWSDGEPIDCDDVLLDWAAYSGSYQAGDDDLFEVEGPDGYDLVAKPECQDGDRTFTYAYRDTFADWQSLPRRLMPAHVAEAQSGVEDTVAAVAADDMEDLAALAAFWNSGWERPDDALDASLVPSSGPFVLSEWEPGRVLLEANPRWWGTPPGVSRIELVEMDRSDRPRALLDGVVQVAELPPDADVVSQVRSSERLVVERGASFDLAQVRFAAAGSLESLRAAFSDCVPRRRVVDEQVAPLLVDAEPAQSRFYFSFQPQYEDVASAVTNDRYDSVRVDAARAALEAAGAVGVRVRLAFDPDDPRQSGAARAITASCGEAGFDVVGVGDVGLREGAADAALDVDEGGPLVSDAVRGYRTDGRTNTGGYSDEAADALVRRLLVTPDPAAQVELVKELDALLWNEMPTLPLYAVPVVVAHDPDVEGVSLQPSDAGVTWNVSSWTLASATPPSP